MQRLEPGAGSYPPWRARYSLDQKPGLYRKSQCFERTRQNTLPAARARRVEKPHAVSSERDRAEVRDTSIATAKPPNEPWKARENRGAAAGGHHRPPTGKRKTEGERGGLRWPHLANGVLTSIGPLRPFSVPTRYLLIDDL